MKAETDMDPLEIPESLVRKWKLTPEDCGKNGDLADKIMEMLNEFEGKVMPHDEGRFLIDYTLSRIPSGGGYPKESSMDVDDVEVVAFGWSSELEEKHNAIQILGLRKPSARRKKQALTRS